MEKRMATQDVDDCMDEQEQNSRISILPPGVIDAGQVGSHGHMDGPMI